MIRLVMAEGSGKQVTRQVKARHEARVAIVQGDHLGAPMLELTENGYGDWQLVRRPYGQSSPRVVLAEGTL